MNDTTEPSHEPDPGRVLEPDHGAAAADVDSYRADVVYTALRAAGQARDAQMKDIIRQASGVAIESMERTIQIATQMQAESARTIAAASVARQANIDMLSRTAGLREELFKNLTTVTAQFATANAASMANIANMANRAQVDVASAISALIKDLDLYGTVAQALNANRAYADMVAGLRATQAGVFAEAYKAMVDRNAAMRDDLLAGLNVATRFADIVANFDFDSAGDKAEVALGELVETIEKVTDLPAGLSRQARLAIGVFLFVTVISLWNSTAQHYPEVTAFISEEVTPVSIAWAIARLVISKLDDGEQQ